MWLLTGIGVAIVVGCVVAFIKQRMDAAAAETKE